MSSDLHNPPPLWLITYFFDTQNQLTTIEDNAEKCTCLRQYLGMRESHNYNQVIIYALCQLDEYGSLLGSNSIPVTSGSRAPNFKLHQSESKIRLCLTT